MSETKSLSGARVLLTGATTVVDLIELGPQGCVPGVREDLRDSGVGASLEPR